MTYKPLTYIDRRPHKDFYDIYDENKFRDQKRYLLSAFHRPEFENSITTLKGIREAMGYVLGEKMFYHLEGKHNDFLNHSSIYDADDYSRFVQPHLYYLAGKVFDPRFTTKDWLKINTDYGYLFQDYHYDRTIDFENIKFWKGRNAEIISNGSMQTASSLRIDAVDYLKKQDINKLLKSLAKKTDFDLSDFKSRFLMIANSDNRRKHFYLELIDDGLNHHQAEFLMENFRAALFAVLNDYKKGKIKEFSMEDFEYKLFFLADQSFDDYTQFGIREALRLYKDSPYEKMRFVQEALNYKEMTKDEFEKDNGLVIKEKILLEYKYMKRRESLIKDAFEKNIPLNRIEEALAVSVLTNRMIGQASQYTEKEIKKIFNMNNRAHDFIEDFVAFERENPAAIAKSYNVRNSINLMIKLGRAVRLDQNNFSPNLNVYSYRNESSYSPKSKIGG